MRLFLSLVILFIFSFSTMIAQTIVGTDPENKNVVLEEFTGIHCPNCPDGHAIAQSIYDAHPDDVVLINIHTGSFAVPGAGEPDFRTTWGNAIAAQAGIIGYPAGTINRHLFPGHSQGSGTAQSRSSWPVTSSMVLAEPSYLNVGAEATIVTSTRQLVVEVEVYYTGDSPESSNFLNVAVLQNNILGPQTGGGAGNNYNHMHMLRHLLTGQWGVEIIETTEGSLYSATFAYELPEDYNDVEVVLENLDVAAFVTESHQEVVSGNLAGITMIESNNYDAAINFVQIPQQACSGELSPVVLLKNYGANNLTSLDYTYSVNDGETVAYTWTGNLAQNETAMVTLPVSEFNATDNNSVTISCELPNGEIDELPQNDHFTGEMAGSQTFPEVCNFGVQSLGDPQDITWSITDTEGNILIDGGPYETSGLHFTEFIFPETGCYTLTLNDASGEGLSGGYYFITDSNQDLLWMGADFTDVASTELAYGMVVDIEEKSTSENITVYPNPVLQIANLEFSLSDHTFLEIFVIDVLGKNVRMIHQGTLHSGHHHIQLDATGLAKGMYFVKFRSENEVVTKKIIISK
ncbi:MAG: Omp28-related outer membrane protein [Bacteroidetes bacterium]|nr:Omp28-related outer membrane protein [Bacteroidota bacterium]